MPIFIKKLENKTGSSSPLEKGKNSDNVVVYEITILNLVAGSHLVFSKILP